MRILHCWFTNSRQKMDSFLPSENGDVEDVSDISSLPTAASSSTSGDSVPPSPISPSYEQGEIFALLERHVEKTPPLRMSADDDQFQVHQVGNENALNINNELQREATTPNAEDNLDGQQQKCKTNPHEKAVPPPDDTIGIQSALYYACMSGQLAEAARALDQGADPNADVFIIEGRGRRRGRHVHVPNLLLSASVSAGDVHMSSLLISRGANASRRDSEGLTPLHHLVTCRHYPETLATLARLLAAAGADPNAQDGHGRTPLHLAATAGHTAAVQALIRLQGVTLLTDERGQTALHAAVRAGSDGAVMLLMDFQPNAIHLRNKLGETPLQKAATSEVARLLLDGGAQLDSATIAGLLKRAPTAVLGALDRCVSTNGECLDSAGLHVYVDYSPFRSGDTPQRLTGEDDLLHHVISSGTHDHILHHPVIETFLYAKWRRVRHFFYFNFAFYLLFTASLTVYCTETSHHLWLWVLMTLLVVGMAAREAFQMIHDGKLYFAGLENWLELVLVAMTTAILAGDGRDGLVNSKLQIGAWQTHLKAWALFAAWYELTLMVARFPTVGVYIYMVEGAAKKLVLLLTIFSPLAAGFALGFHALFHEQVAFHSLVRSLLTTFLMAMGELDYEAFSTAADAWPGTAHALLVLLVASLSIVTVNLLIGLSVADTADVTQRAGTQRLRHTALLLLHVQQAVRSQLLRRLLPSRLMLLLQRRSLILPQLRVQSDTAIPDISTLTRHDSPSHAPRPKYQAAFTPNRHSDRKKMFSITESGKLMNNPLQTRSAIQRHLLALLKERQGNDAKPTARVSGLKTHPHRDGGLDFIHLSRTALQHQPPSHYDSLRSKASRHTDPHWTRPLRVTVSPLKPTHHQVTAKVIPQNGPSPESTPERRCPHSRRHRKRSVCERDAAAVLSQKINTVLAMLHEMQTRANVMQRKLEAHFA